MEKKIQITGTGCALADFVYNGISFNSPEFKKYLSKKEDDGGFSPGKLLFTEELEKFAGKSYSEVISEITGNRAPVTFNIGGTAITPNLHDHLHTLLDKAKAKGAITVINTVYDFRNEKKHPDKPWPLGDTEKSFPNIDILVIDYEEALKISGTRTTNEAFEYFREKVSSFIITRRPGTTVFLF